MKKIHKEVNLTIDPRIISHLGEALIDNEKIALLELIKNASDADANNCNIEIDTLYQSPYGQGRIVIEDDGNGMTPFIIENAFLKIATSFKTNHQKISPKFKRQAQGNKGIGRLSLNQLGRFVSVDTKIDIELSEFFSEEDLQENFGYPTKRMMIEDNEFYCYHVDIDWERYRDSDGTVESVKLDLQTNLFNDTIFSHKKTHGTRIEVLGLKGIDFWQSTQVQNEIEQDVLEFLNPYLEEKYNFYVKINLDGKIVSSNKYDLEDIENNFLSKVDFSFNSQDSNLVLHI
ncbi:TPA: ATP-binding protein, partial [Streptococcus suis]